MSSKNIPATGHSSPPEKILPESQSPSNGHHPAGKLSASGHMTSPHSEIASLLTQLARKERDLQMLAHQLAARDTELAQIKASRSWRWMGHFWEIRNEYVLPVLRPVLKLLGLARPQLQATETLVQPALLPESAPQTSVLPGTSSRANAYDVICFPIIDWDFRFQRPQHLMTQFAAAGHRVFYISHSFCGIETPYQIKEKAKNIYEVTLSGAELSVYRDQLDAYQRAQLFFSLDTLRRLPEYFPTPGHMFPLDPSFEPDRNALKPDQLLNFPENKANQKIFAELQACNRHGLVVPVDAAHMFFAAMESTGCRLTAIGAHYRALAEARRI